MSVRGAPRSAKENNIEKIIYSSSIDLWLGSFRITFKPEKQDQQACEGSMVDVDAGQLKK
jgi:hypothetical protein